MIRNTSLALCMIVTLAVHAEAAPITWNGSFIPFNDATDVANSGMIAEAGNVNGTDVRVNGVYFEGTGASNSNGITQSGTGWSLSIGSSRDNASVYTASADGVLNMLLDGLHSGTTLTLTGLIPGASYNVQVWGMDDRFTNTDNSQFSDGEGVPNLSASWSNNGAGGQGSAVGSFVASGTTQTIIALDDTTNESKWNAFSVALDAEIVTPNSSSQSYETITTGGGNITTFNNGPWDINNGGSLTNKGIDQTFDDSGVSAPVTSANVNTVETTIGDWPGNNGGGWWVAPNDEKTGVLRYVFDSEEDFTGIALWANTPVSGKGNFAPTIVDVWVGDGTDYTLVLDDVDVTSGPDTFAQTFDFEGIFAGTEIVIDLLGSQTSASNGEVAINEFRAFAIETATIPTPGALPAGLIALATIVMRRRRV